MIHSLYSECCKTPTVLLLLKKLTKIKKKKKKHLVADVYTLFPNKVITNPKFCKRATEKKNFPFAFSNTSFINMLDNHCYNKHAL